MLPLGVIPSPSSTTDKDPWYPVRKRTPISGNRPTVHGVQSYTTSDPAVGYDPLPTVCVIANRLPSG